MFIHSHKRKRKAAKSKSLHSEKKQDPKIKFLDQAVTVVSVIFPFSALPQIYTIWIHRQVEGVSFTSWLLWFILNSILLAYGIVHKEKRLVILWGLWTIMYIFVLSGLLIYR